MRSERAPNRERKIRRGSQPTYRPIRAALWRVGANQTRSPRGGRIIPELHRDGLINDKS